MISGTKLYVMRGDEFTKVGITKRVYSRVMTVNSTIPFNVSVIMISNGRDASIRKIERILKETMPGRVKGEWFETAHLPYDLLREIVLSVSQGRGVRLYEGDAVPAFMDAERAVDKANDSVSNKQSLASRWQRGGFEAGNIVQ